MSAKPYTAIPEGVRLAVRLTPRAARNGVDGVVLGGDGRPLMQIRLTAPPVEGAANEALVAFLSDILDLHKRDVAIRSGQKSRLKIVELRGDSAILLAKLSSLSP